MNKLQSSIKYLKELKDMKDKKNEELKAINKEIEMYERELIEKMELEGVDKVSIAGVGTAYVTTKDYPQVVDMETFVKWCYENNRTDMLQKRITATAYNQFVSEENIMPEGTDVFQKTTLNFRRS